MKKKINQEEILNDLDKRGKKRDWSRKKKSSLKLSSVYSDIAQRVKLEYEKCGVHIRFDKRTGVKPVGLYNADGRRVVNYEKRAENMRFCSSHLEFLKMAEQLKLIKANFCRVPLCPMCQWRKSLRIYTDVSRIMKIIEMRPDYATYVPVFLTLTVKNCSLPNLGETLNTMFDGWNELMRSGELNPKSDGKPIPIVKGWFRALEVEYKHKTDEFHPHFHVIMLVERSYFTGKNYKSTADWVQLWRRFAKLDYDPICDIRKTRTSKDKRNE
ncbi:MAG: protein rep, partial [Treponema sp.]|nr:protein rep [Treponema sp.]